MLNSKSEISPDRDRIAELAHDLWRQEGCPEGRALDHWLRAEAQVRSSEAETVAAKGSENIRSATLPPQPTGNAKSNDGSSNRQKNPKQKVRA